MTHNCLDRPCDIKIDSRFEFPYSVVYGVTPEGESELKLRNLKPNGDSGGWIICNLDLIDVIEDMEKKGMKVL